MSGTGNATQKSPDPSWGRPIMQADGAHLKFYDARRGQFKVLVPASVLIGIAALWAGASFGSALPFKLGPFVAFGGFLMAVAGPYGMFRSSFAEHRMFGMYDRGFVPPIHYKGGWDPFVPWAGVRAVKVLHFPLGTPTGLGRHERFVFRMEDERGWPHRIRETDLARLFGYSEEECLRIKEEVLAAVRLKLPSINVEMPSGAPQAAAGNAMDGPQR